MAPTIGDYDGTAIEAPETLADTHSAGDRWALVFSTCWDDVDRRQGWWAILWNTWQGRASEALAVQEDSDIATCISAGVKSENKIAGRQRDGHWRYQRPPLSAKGKDHAV